jgi:hypothetical protein
MKTFLCFLVLILFSFNGYAEHVVTTLDITQLVTFPGPQLFDPVVLRNTDKNEWLLIWTEASNGKFRTYGRLVSDNGGLAASKKLKEYKPSVFFNTPMDAQYDPDHGIYMLLYNTSKGVLSQAYQSSLAKKGTPKNLTAQFKPLDFFFPQIEYDPDTRIFNVYGGTTEKGCPGGCPQDVVTFNINDTGKVISAPDQILTGVIRPIIELDAFRNPITKDTLLLLRGVSDPDLVGYIVKPDGTLLKKTALKISTRNPSAQSIRGSAAFDLSGAGIISWTLLSSSDRSQQTKFRPIKATETQLGKTKKLPKGGFPPDFSFYQATAIVFDDSHSEYVILWHDLGALKGIRTNVAGKLIGNVFTLANVNVSPDGAITDISVAYDPASGNMLAVWAEHSTFSAEGQVRAVIFEK